ncbi:MAG TPA: heme biosynthesis HemY N-terminal domain-containing protein [Xanthomonadaceae bacterium]|nr:heme biosynthesis HemY N-terminal domain-containing protein [Xanthomonadaceae bacterium]
MFARVLVLLALAAAGAWLWFLLAQDPGYVRVIWRGWSAESTLVVAALALLLAWAVLALGLWLLRLPLRSWRSGRRRRARERLAGGLVALHEGRLVEAERLLVRAARDREQALPALLYAARAAQVRGEDERAEELLSEAAGEVGGDTALLLIRCERLLAQGHSAQAEALLAAAAARSALPPRGVELQLRAMAGSGRAAQALGLLAGLRRTQALESAAQAALEIELQSAALHESADLATLKSRWRTLSRVQRHEPALVDAYAARAGELGDGELGAGAIEATLKRGWDETLALRLGSLPAEQHGPRIRRAEAWLQAHPDSPALLTSLGRLCRRERLWGKAEDYLQRALAHGAGAVAWEELGRVFGEQQDETRARECLANALRTLRGEAPRPLPVRGLVRAGGQREPTEERDAHGVPRLSGEPR